MKSKRHSVSGTAFSIANHAILLVFFVMCMYPFYYIFLYSVSDPIQAQKGIAILPVGFTLHNYADIVQLKGIAGAALISVLRTVLGTGITMFCCTFFAYLVTKQEMPLRRLSYRILVASMYFSAGLIPYYLTLKAYQLNNFLVYIVPSALSGFNVILIKTYIEQLPSSLEESATIDGAGYFTIFWKIILPLSMPVIATIVVFAAVGQWNSWFDNYIFVQDKNLKTLQLILYDYLNNASFLATASNADKNRGLFVQTTPQTIRMTITMVVTLPILLVYPFMQRYFVKGIMLGAIKG